MQTKIETKMDPTVQPRQFARWAVGVMMGLAVFATFYSAGEMLAEMSAAAISLTPTSVSKIDAPEIVLLPAVNSTGLVETPTVMVSTSSPLPPAPSPPSATGSFVFTGKAPAEGPYASRQTLPPPFPPSYESRLSRAAKHLSVAVPDIYRRQRSEETPKYGPCPPHDLDDRGNRVASMDLAKNLSVRVRKNDGAKKGTGEGEDKGTEAGWWDPKDPLARPTLESLSGVTVGLVVVSFNSPLTLNHSVKAWSETGLLDLVDDALLFLNAPQQVEKDLGTEFGFRVYTPSPDVLQPALNRHHSFLSQKYGEEAFGRFPRIKNFNDDPARPATMVGPSQMISYLEMQTDVVIFAEKDWVPAPGVGQRALVKSLLATVGLLASNTQVVRMRHSNDPNKDGMPDCCNGGCGGSYSGFSQTCHWNSHLDWLAVFCDPSGVEGRSKGAIGKCPFDDKLPGALASDDDKNEGPLSAYCFSFDHSGWSNNIAAFRRTWWIEAMGHVAIYSEGTSNAELELNGMMMCDYCPRHKLGSGANNEQSPMICQLDPGIFNHVEIDSRR